MRITYENIQNRTLCFEDNLIDEIAQVSIVRF
jgi:hypothetical protein